ncbi:hypothetical protein PM082_018158 [Marasmius tenuissimus]|nr:hypothetical protein PM082_018158 [Marasmius tenuissimus]
MATQTPSTVNAQSKKKTAAKQISPNRKIQQSEEVLPNEEPGDSDEDHVDGPPFSNEEPEASDGNTIKRV